MGLLGHRVYVTPKDISEGERCSPNYCPIGRAVTRMIRRTKQYRSCEVRVNISNISIERYTKGVKKRIAFFLLPMKVVNFINNFDNYPAFQITEAQRFNFRLSDV